MARVVAIVLILVSASAFAQTDSVTQQIQSMYDSRLQRFQSAPTPEAMAGAYVEDIVDEAVWMPQGGPRVRGKAAVREWAVDFFATWVLEITNSEFEPIRVGESLAIRRWTSNGVYVERSTGRRIAFSQKYMDTLQKQADGTWKLESHMWSSNDREQSIWAE